MKINTQLTSRYLDDGVMDYCIFPHGLRLDAEAYIKGLEDAVLTCIMERVTTGRP